MNSDLEDLRKWLIANKLSLNVAKTEFILIGSKPMLTQISNEHPKVSIGNKSIKQAKQCKMLGVEIDQHLTWKSNTENICKKANSGIFALRSLKPFFDKDTLLSVYNSVEDAEMRKATSDGVAIKSKMRERDPMSEEDEAPLWEKRIFGCNSAKSLFRTIYFYNGKLFGLRSTEHRNLRYSNFSIVSESVSYDESVSKTYHGGLKDLKYKPRVVKHVCSAEKDVG